MDPFDKWPNGLSHMAQRNKFLSSLLPCLLFNFRIELGLASVLYMTPVFRIFWPLGESWDPVNPKQVSAGWWRWQGRLENISSPGVGRLCCVFMLWDCCLGVLLSGFMYSGASVLVIERQVMEGGCDTLLSTVTSDDVDSHVLRLFGFTNCMDHMPVLWGSVLCFLRL